MAIRSFLTPSGRQKTYVDDEGSQRLDRRYPNPMDSMFWRVMGWIMAGLVSIAIWVGKNNIDKLDKINDSMIESRTILVEIQAEQQKIEARTGKNEQDIQSLKIAQSLQQQLLDERARNQTR